MLSEDQFELAYALRLYVGSNSIGIGPDLGALLPLVDGMGPQAIAAALNDLEGLGFIRVDRALPTHDHPGPRELRGVVGVAVLERLQQFFDDKGL
ncbi:MAG: hypothetical protein JWP35_2534 [Caulobacter sp.]|nr:hypothetical protein [Caulobacter sp.]